MLTPGLSQPIIRPKETWLHKQNVGSLGSIGMSAWAKCATPDPANAPVFRELVSTATLATILVGLVLSVTALTESPALEPPEKCYNTIK